MWSVQALTLCILLFAVWLHDRSQRHYLLFCIGFGLNSLGGQSMFLRGPSADFLEIYLGNLMVLAALATWTNGLRLFDGRKISAWPVMTPLIWGVLNLYSGIYNDFSNRLIVYSLSVSIGHIFMASTLLTCRMSTARYRCILAGLWTIQSTLSLIFGVYGFVTHPQSLASIPFIGAIVLFYMICMVSTIVLLAKIIMDRNELKLKQLAITDPLTGAMNRRGLIEAARQFKQRSGKDGLLAFLVFDLDHFKSINDTHGHQVGDTVLVHFANMVSAVIAKSGIDDGGLFARSGGEEFCALVQVENLRQAAGLAEQIRTIVASTPIVIGAVTVRLTTSIGVSGVNVSEFDFDLVMRQADHGLYKAKAEGRNRTAIARDDSVYCLGPALEPGSPAAIDQDTDLQVAALRRLTQRQLHPEP